MADLGTLFDKLARNAGMSITDRIQLRQKGLALEALGPQMSVLFGAGEVDPHFNNFYAVEGEFETLPHPMASLYHATQAVTTGTTYQSMTVLDPSGATWGQGLSIDTSAATILVPGLPVGAVMEFTLWAQFAGNATGVRSLQWIELGASGAVKKFEFNPHATHPTYLSVFHKRRVATADTTYQLQVFQDSGGDLNVDALIVAERVQ